MSQPLSAAPSYSEYTAAWAAHKASAIANGGQHSTTLVAAKEIQRKRVKCELELNISIAPHDRRWL